MRFDTVWTALDDAIVYADTARLQTKVSDIDGVRRALDRARAISAREGSRQEFEDSHPGLEEIGGRVTNLAPIPIFAADPAKARPPVFSDEALALLFAERHAFDLRFVAAWGKWVSWTGRHWKFDDTIYAFDLARRICREVAAGCNNPKIASAIASAKTVAAVDRLARADRAWPRPSTNGTRTLGCSIRQMA